MNRDPLQHVDQIRVRIHAVQHARRDQALDDPDLLGPPPPSSRTTRPSAPSGSRSHSAQYRVDGRDPLPLASARWASSPTVLQRAPQFRRCRARRD
jgi:hypothetical protein